MNDRIKSANVWRNDKVRSLVEACRDEESAPIDTAMLAVSIPGARPGDTGFSVSDLRFHHDRLIDRADAVEMRIVDKAGKLAWMRKTLERITERAEREADKARRIGGTVSREQFAEVRESARKAAADVESLRDKCESLAGFVSRLESEVDSLRGAAALIGDLIEAKTARRTQAITQGVLVEVEG